MVNSHSFSKWLPRKLIIPSINLRSHKLSDGLDLGFICPNDVLINAKSEVYECEWVYESMTKETFLMV